MSALLAAGARTVDWRRAGVYALFVFVLFFFLEYVLPSLDINSSIAEGGLEGQETTPMLSRISDPDVIVG